MKAMRVEAQEVGGQSKEELIARRDEAIKALTEYTKSINSDSARMALDDQYLAHTGTALLRSAEATVYWASKLAEIGVALDEIYMLENI